MKSFTKNTLLALCLAGVMAPSGVFAHPIYDSVKDARMNHVLDSNGNCVRTKWEVGVDPCGPDSVDPIKAVMKMDERKIYFDFDKDNLKESELRKLDVIADALKHHKLSAVKIVGYTDRIGTSAYNQKLSERRADAVSTHLNKLVKLNSSIVELRALGKAHQVKGCEGIKNRSALIECLAPNRRVELEVDYIANNLTEPKQ